MGGGPTLLRAVHGVSTALEPVASSMTEYVPPAYPEPVIAAIMHKSPVEYAPVTPEAAPERTRPALPTALVSKGHKLNQRALEKTGKPASIRGLMAELKCGQDRAKAVRDALLATP